MKVQVLTSVTQVMCNPKGLMWVADDKFIRPFWPGFLLQITNCKFKTHFPECLSMMFHWYSISLAFTLCYLSLSGILKDEVIAFLLLLHTADVLHALSNVSPPLRGARSLLWFFQRTSLKNLSTAVFNLVAIFVLPATGGTIWVGRTVSGGTGKGMT